MKFIKLHRAYFDQKNHSYCQMPIPTYINIAHIRVVERRPDGHGSFVLTNDSAVGSSLDQWFAETQEEIIGLIYHEIQQ